MAKRYRFRLERVRRLRDRAREDRRLAHTAAVRDREGVVEQIDRLRSIADAEREQLAAGLQGGNVVVEQAIHARAYEGLLLRAQHHLDDRLRQAEQLVTQQRLELLQAEREVKVLDKLDERGREAHALLENREELALLDELASIGMHRRRSVEAEGQG